MVNVEDILLEFNCNHEIGAYSGASETLNYIREGKEHLIYPFYKEVCGYGDWEKVSGIERIVDALNRRDLLKNPLPQIYFEANDTLGEEWVLDEDYDEPREEVELFFRLTEGKYKIMAELDKNGSNEHYVFSVETQSGGLIERGSGYTSGEEAYFMVNKYEEGVVKVTITPMMWTKLIRYVVDEC